MSHRKEFMREERYIVVKIKDIGNMELEGKLRHMINHELDCDLIDGVVTESHWPNHEHVWKTTEQIASGEWSEGRWVWQAATEQGEPVAEFGNGDWIVEVGGYGDKPAVFVAPADPPGVPGELAPPTSEEDKHRLLDGEWFMTFPTEAQAFAVADALTGRKLKRLDGTRPDDAKPSEGGVPDSFDQLPDEAKDQVYEAVSGALGEAYDCVRVWSAWSHGTMGSDDFVLTGEDGERVNEIASAAIDALLATQQPPEQENPE